MELRLLFILLTLISAAADVICANQVTKPRQKEPALIFVEYGDISFDQEKQHLDNLAARLKSKPHLIGYIIVYAGRKAHPNEGRQHANRLYSYLFNVQEIAERRIMTVDGGFREGPAVEIFLVSRKTTEPDPRPTMGPDDVEFIDDDALSATANHKKVDELLSLALSKVEPKYPPLAKAARVTGEVWVRVVVDEGGRVVSHRTMFGHPLLQEAAERAAREWTFRPTNEAGKLVKVAGLLVFTFDL